MGVIGVLLGVLALTAHAAQAGAASPTPAPDPTTEPVVELVLFWGEGCPHCAAEHAWLAEVRDDFPLLRVTEHEVYRDEDNLRLLQETAAAMGFEPSGVPVTVVGESYWVGFSDDVADEIERALTEAGAAGPSATPRGDSGAPAGGSVDVPLVGEVAVSADDLVVATLVIGFVDGVNPCSLWVISVLLTIVVRTGSRRRVLAVGTTFLVVTAAMYALYMAGIYSAMNVLESLGAVQAVVAVVAGVLGVVSVKDYFAFRRGPSFSIPDRAKPGIYHRMRAAAGQQALLPALAATTLLAVGVSLLETPCTAGFPVLWTGLLATADVGTAQAAWLFGLYLLPFLLDEVLVFALAVLTLRATKLQERHGRLLKLVAGTTMLALAVTVLVRPAVMSDPATALLVLGSALLVAGLVHLVTTRWAQRRQGAGLPSSHQESERVSQGRTR